MSRQVSPCPRPVAARRQLAPRHEERFMALLRRTHTCGELREVHVGQTVVLNGWVNTYRNQGSLVFIDLRDRYGITQVVFEPECPAELKAAARELRSEFVVA